MRGAPKEEEEEAEEQEEGEGVEEEKIHRREKAHQIRLSCRAMPSGRQRFSDMEMLVGMEDEQVDTARSRAGSCVEFHSIRVSFFSFLWGRGVR